MDGRFSSDVLSSPVIIGCVEAADPTESVASLNTGYASANSMIEKEVEGGAGGPSPPAIRNALVVTGK